jgi:hypothetical protein
MFTNYSGHEFGFLQVVEVCPMAFPETVYYGGGSRGSKSIWSQCSKTTFDKMNTTGVLGGGAFEVVEQSNRGTLAQGKAGKGSTKPKENQQLKSKSHFKIKITSKVKVTNQKQNKHSKFKDSNV